MQIDLKMIPPEVVEAAARAAWETKYKGLGWLLDCPEKHKVQWRDRARAAITAALNAWPGMTHSAGVGPCIILPLPQQASDD